MTATTDIAISTVEKGFNPLLKKLNDRIPGETFRLPSMGLMYTDGELDPEVKNGEVLIKPMTTLDDIYMKTPDMLFQGTAIEAVIRRCVPQVLKPLQLFSHDIDFILICLKKVSSGAHTTIKHTCSECSHKQEYDIPLNYFIQNSRAFNPETLKELKLELSNGFTVEIQPSRMGDILTLMQINEEVVGNDPEKIDDLIAKNLCANIKKVDDITDVAMIEEWAKGLPASIKSEFVDKIEISNNWGTNFEYDLVCGVNGGGVIEGEDGMPARGCGAKQHIVSSINPLFFFIQR